MNILEELNSVLGGLGLPLETGVFSGKAPDEYLVIVPISDGFGYHADNTPHEDVQEARATAQAALQGVRATARRAGGQKKRRRSRGGRGL